MRIVCLSVGILYVALVYAAEQERTPPALVAARTAMGGGALDSVRTLRLIGRAARDFGVMRLSGHVELRVAFPARYVRVDRFTLGGPTSEMAVGFNGAAPIQWASGPGGVRIDPAALVPESARAAAVQAAIDAARQELALLLLGFGLPLESYPFEFSSDGTAEAPDGTADVIAVRHAAGLTARLFIDARSRLPLMVSWSGPDVLDAARTVTGSQQRRPGPADREAVLAQVPVVEHRIYFSDYRPNGRLRWPFRVRRAVKNVLVEDLAFDTLDVNVALDEGAFRPEP
jgi:hypothetical protein